MCGEIRGPLLDLSSIIIASLFFHLRWLCFFCKPFSWLIRFIPFLLFLVLDWPPVLKDIYVARLWRELLHRMECLVFNRN